METTYLTTTPTKEPTIVDSFESDYEQERGKPMPSENHSYIQTEMSFELKTNYGSQFDIFS